MNFSKELEQKLTNAGLNSEDIETLEELADATSSYDDEDAFIQAIKDDDDLTDEITQLADGQVSVYTSDRFEWAAKNVRTVQEYEEEALSMSDGKSIDNVLGICWMMSEEARMRDLLEETRKALND